MPQLYTTGPCLVYANVGATGPGTGWVMVGTAKQKPRIQVRRAIKEIMNDAGGDKAIDLMYTGQDAIITADINRMSLAAYFGMASCPAPAVPAGALQNAGLDLPGETGTLLATEGQAFQLCLVFPYSAKTAFQNAGNGALPACYNFLLATLESPDDVDPGTQDLTIHMVWHAIRTLVPNSFNGISTWNQQLYSTSLPAGLPAPT